MGISSSRHSALMHSIRLPTLFSWFSTGLQPLYSHIPQSDLSYISSDDSQTEEDGEELIISLGR